MDTTSRPVLLSPDHVTRAVHDPNFYSLLPEFLPVRRKIESMNVDLTKGCPSCRRGRIAKSVTSDFVAVLNQLSDDGFSRLKRYLGAGRLVVRAVNRQTGRVEQREV